MRYAKMPESSDEKSGSEHSSSESAHTHSSEGSEEESSDSEEERRNKTLIQLKEQLKKLTEDIEILSKSSKKSKKKKRKVKLKRTRKDKAVDSAFKEEEASDALFGVNNAAVSTGGPGNVGGQFPTAFPSGDSLPASSNTGNFFIYFEMVFVAKILIDT